jgi:hypothetical protein
MWRALSFVAVCVVGAAAGCATFGATLPPGGDASFLDEAKGAVPFEGQAASEQGALDAATRAHVDANIDVLMTLVGASRELREQIKAGEKEIHAHVEAKDTVDKKDLERIRDIARRYLELDALLYSLWTSYRTHLPYSSEPDPFAPLRAATLLSTSTREAGGLVALAAELVRLDNAAVVVDTLGPHHALTRFLNRGDKQLQVPAEGFDRAVGALYDPDHRNLLERQLRAVAAEQQRLAAAAAADPRVAFLLEVVKESQTGTAVVEEGDFHRRAAYLWQVLSRSTLDAAGPIFDVVIANGYLAQETETEAAAP